MKKYFLEILVFLVGAAGMILELDGSRVLSPYLGTTIVVWSSLIGIILGSLSLGYWLGGRLADRRPSYQVLASLLLVSGILVACIPYIQGSLFTLATAATQSLYIRSVVVCLVLFAPATVLLGMVSPYAVKLKMETLKYTGSTVGNLYAISTLGSITGTFLAGFFLIEYLRTTTVLLLVAAILLAASLLAVGFTRRSLPLQTGLALILVAGLVIFRVHDLVLAQQGFIDTDSQYSRIWIYSGYFPGQTEEARFMQIGNEFSSAMYLNGDKLTFPYTNYYRLDSTLNPAIAQGRGLMLGGAAYSYPKDFLTHYPEAKMDVVEIDPKVTELAKQYFNLKDSDRLNIFHADARTYLNETTQTYDVIYGDAFRSMSVPYQLTTQEAVQRMYDRLTPKGVVILNVISAINGPKSQFFQAEYATYKSVFPQVYAFAVNKPENGTDVQNVMIVALKSPTKPSFVSPDKEIQGYFNHLWTKQVETSQPVLTDEYAPVDRYMLSVM
ncbi:MAG: fused MFS/spermidine synthase [bacterium]